MQAEFVAEIFSQNDIKFVFHEHRKCFYDNVWVKEILAVLRFVFCGQRRSDFFAFINKPFRGFERAMFREEKIDFEEVKKRLTKQKEYSEVKKELEKMEKIFRLMRGMEPYGAVLLVLNGMKFRTYVKESAEGTQMMQEQSEEVLEQLLARAKDFRSVPKFLEYVSEYSRKYESEGVRILTYHASKGLEFERVFLPMLNEGSVLRGHIFTQEQLEEERRMFYVAITRAKRFLYLSYHGKESVFLKEIST
jgi:DNA helicase-2/ATP-dependent DNA helicase PcrA